MSSIVDLKKSQHNRPHQFLRYLCEKHEVTVLSINDWWKGEQRGLDEPRNDFENILKRVDYHYLTEKRISPVLQEVFSHRVARRITKKGEFDIHLNYNSLISSSAFSSEIPTVFDIADDLVSMIDDSPQIPRLLKPIGHRMGEARLRKNIATSTLVTTTSKTLTEKYDIPQYKARLVPNGVDTTLFRNMGDTKKAIGVDGFVIGYVGVLREWVNLLPVFEAMQALDRQISMLVVGREGEFQKNLKLAETCGVADRVKFVGAVRYTDVPKYISAMDICLIPFVQNAVTQNALPLKLFEYMSCGKPVISTDTITIRASVGDGVLYARNAADYVSCIQTLFQQDTMRQRLGRDGRAFVENDYDWSKIVAQLECTLEEALSR